MSHRLQITLTDSQYARLRADSRETGVSIAELIRRRIDAQPDDRDLHAAISASAGILGMNELDGARRVEELRRGADERRKTHGW